MGGQNRAQRCKWRKRLDDERKRDGGCVVVICVGKKVGRGGRENR